MPSLSRCKITVYIPINGILLIRTASQQLIAAVTDRARQFVESIMDCRSSSAVQDDGQSNLLTPRVDALEDTVKDLDRQMGSVNTKMDKFETTMAAIHNQLKAMKESNDKMTSQVTAYHHGFKSVHLGIHGVHLPVQVFHGVFESNDARYQQIRLTIVLHGRRTSAIHYGLDELSCTVCNGGNLLLAGCTRLNY
ncbi:hypothetical protein E4U31_006678 [Claviceps sp. LM219 group G6]|nr:hypothetical protein E4U31_006678 [Claviceps sp. LM219 group G6]